MTWSSGDLSNHEFVVIKVFCRRSRKRVKEETFHLDTSSLETKMPAAKNRQTQLPDESFILVLKCEQMERFYLCQGIIKVDSRGRRSCLCHEIGDSPLHNIVQPAGRFWRRANGGSTAHSTVLLII